MMKYRYISAITMFMVVLLQAGCMILDEMSGPIYSPHQTFLNHYGGYVGKSVQVVRSRGPQPISVKQLPNGNIEEEYWLRNGACRYYYEVDHKTWIIVRWRYEGGEENCVKPPYT